MEHLLLEAQWNSGRIAGRMKREGILIGHETIYRLVRLERQVGNSLDPPWFLVREIDKCRFPAYYSFDRLSE